jgi:hypothetical protein
MPAPALPAPGAVATEESAAVLAPTAGHRWYATYPVQFLVGHPAAPLTRLASLTEARAHRAVREGRAPVRAEQVAPDGRPVVESAWAGGTWSGRCGATCWVVDDGGLLQRQERTLQALGAVEVPGQSGGVAPRVSTTQRWWLHGLRTRADGWDGFRVECEQPFRHDAPCQALTGLWRGRWDARGPHLAEANAHLAEADAHPTGADAAGSDGSVQISGPARTGDEAGGWRR